MSEAPFELAPAQRRALDELFARATPGQSVVLQANDGNGKTTMLRAAHARMGGIWLDAADLQSNLSSKHPLAVEETFYDLVSRALDDNAVVFIDDVDLLFRMLEHSQSYPRNSLLPLGIKALVARIAATGKTLIASGSMMFESMGASVGSWD